MEQIGILSKAKFEAAGGDKDYLTKLLPKHYIITQVKSYMINCISGKGILKNVDAEDDEHWSYIMSGLRQHFGSRFIGVNHTVCYGHMDFSIHLKD